MSPNCPICDVGGFGFVISGEMRYYECGFCGYKETRRE